MPGIAGIIGLRPGSECECLVKSMIRSMEHEPFYISGVYSAPEMRLYAGWVALEDSFAAGQVFVNEQKDVALIFSGECFEHPEILASLRQKRNDRGRDSGAWLLQLYEDKGDQFFEKLNGLFSGVLIDKRQGKIFLFNDRYGVGRIYWHETTEAIYFASEAKALLRVLPQLRAFDEEGVAQFLTFGCTLDGRTLFRGVRLLPGGALWTFQAGKCHKTKYFSPQTWESQPTLSAQSFLSLFRETFQRVLPRYFESASRIGISLTAGLDSRMIMACRPNTDEPPVCYTFCGQNRNTLDARLAARIAKACGLEHEILRIDADFFSDFTSHVDRTVYLTDGCAGVLAAHEIYLNRRARRLAPVRLTGVFGGEILRGVSMFKPIGLCPRLPNPDLAESLSAFAQGWKDTSQHPVTFAAFREIPEKRFGVPAASRSQVTFRTPYLDNEIVALAYQTPEILRTSSITASAVIKNGDSVLSNIPTDMGPLDERGIGTAFRCFFSKVTRKLDYLYSEGLPHWMSPLDFLLTPLNCGLGVVAPHKFLHYRRWFRRELADYATGVLRDLQCRSSSLWNPDFLASLVHEHTSGGKNYVLEIDAVLTLEAVERLLFRDLPREAEHSASAISPAALASI